MKTDTFLQRITPQRRASASRWAVLAALAAGALPMVAYSQTALDAGTSGKISIVPRISVAETYTSNVSLSSTGARSELITEISPGIRISSTGGRITGYVNYSLNEILYARNTSGRSSQNQLDAFGTMEVIDTRGYIDFNGTVSQQAISAFGAPATNSAALNGNSTETSVFRLSPHISGRIASLADYQARYSLSSSQSGSAAASDVNSKQLSLQLNSVGSRVGAGWTLAVDRQDFDYSDGRSTQSRRVSGQLNYPFNDQIGAYMKGVQESDNYSAPTLGRDSYTALGLNWTPNEEARVSIDKDSRGAIGLVASWTPSRRTTLSVTRERRQYGDTHSIALSYRTANTAWTFSDTRGTTTSPGQPVPATPSLYDVLYGQFITVEPDPARREQFDAFLRGNGIVPNASAVGGFLTSAVSLQRQQQLSFALLGARSTMTFIVTRSSNRRLDALATVADDLSNSAAVVQNGVSANYSYRLTPRALLSVIAARQTAGGSATQPGTSTRSVNVNLSATLTKDTSATIGARRVVFDSSTAPYTETAVIGNLIVQF